MLKKDYIYILLIILLFTVGIYFVYENYKLEKSNKTLDAELAETKSELTSSTASMQHTIDLLTADRYDLHQELDAEINKFNALSIDVNTITGTVGTLLKLHNTDAELLKKYSKIYFLNENYVPKELFSIDPKYVYEKEKDLKILSGVSPFLQSLLDAAATTGMLIISAYRSFYDQTNLKFTYKITYGSGANRFSADQGYSEHQLGTAIDFTTKNAGITFSDFEKTPTYEWLLNNAYKYGFILSYPKNISYYIYESWHWRFVGRSLAKKLHDDNRYFYDLDQREIDSYLVDIFE